jgi:hypothetical protein
MAPPQCMRGDGNPVELMGTFLSTGESVAVCKDCLPAYAAALLQTLTGIDTSVVFTLQEEVAEQVAQAAEGAPTDEPPAPQPSDTDPKVLQGGNRIQEQQEPADGPTEALPPSEAVS